MTEDPRIAALPDIHGHAKGEHKPFAEERPIPYTARMLFLWFYHACRRGSPRFLMVADHMNYLTFEDPAAVNLVRRALKLAKAGDLYGAAETAGVDLAHAAAVSEGLRKGIRYSIGAEVDNDPRCRPDAQNIVDAMRPDGMVRSVHFLPITHPQHGEGWMWPFDNPEFIEFYDVVGTERVWELYMETLLEAIDKLPGHIVAHFYVPAKFGHWPGDEALEAYEDKLLDACAERGMAVEVNSRYIYKFYAGDEAQLERYRTAHLRLLRKAKEKGVAVAVGSDAHSPKDQGRAFDAVLALLDEAEINEIAFPINGRLARVALRATEEILRQAAGTAPAPALPAASANGSGGVPAEPDEPVTTGADSDAAEATPVAAATGAAGPSELATAQAVPTTSEPGASTAPPAAAPKKRPSRKKAPAAVAVAAPPADGSSLEESEGSADADASAAAETPSPATGDYAAAPAGHGVHSANDVHEFAGEPVAGDREPESEATSEPPEALAAPQSAGEPVAIEPEPAVAEHELAEPAIVPATPDEATTVYEGANAARASEETHPVETPVAAVPDELAPAGELEAVAAEHAVEPPEPDLLPETSAEEAEVAVAAESSAGAAAGEPAAEEPVPEPAAAEVAPDADGEPHPPEVRSKAKPAAPKPPAKAPEAAPKPPSRAASRVAPKPAAPKAGAVSKTPAKAAASAKPAAPAKPAAKAPPAKTAVKPAAKKAAAAKPPVRKTAAKPAAKKIAARPAAAKPAKKAASKSAKPAPAKAAKKAAPKRAAPAKKSVAKKAAKKKAPRARR